jgi:hypothetical protein
MITHPFPNSVLYSSYAKDPETRTRSGTATRYKDVKREIHRSAKGGLHAIVLIDIPLRAPEAS